MQCSSLQVCSLKPSFGLKISTVMRMGRPLAPACEVGVEDLAADDVLIYPNPTNDFFTIEISDDMNGQLRYELFSLTGKVVLSNEMMETTNTADLSTLTNGVYLCKIFNQNGLIITERIVKN